MDIYVYLFRVFVMTKILTLPYFLYFECVKYCLAISFNEALSWFLVSCILYIISGLIRKAIATVCPIRMTLCYCNH